MKGLLNLLTGKPWSNMRIIIGEKPDFKTGRTNIREDFYFHNEPPEYPKYYFWPHSLQKGGLLSKDHDAQPCLNKDSLLDDVIEHVLKISSNKTITIGMGDNKNWCTCNRCASESPTNTFVRFVNSVAEKFPRKQFSALMYYKTEPVSSISLAKNVSIILTTIELAKHEPYEDSKRDDTVVWKQCLQGWLNMIGPDRITIWDYYGNFNHLLAPCPMWYSIGPNIRFFAKKGIKNFIIQTDSAPGHEFDDLKNELIGEMLSNPFQDSDKLIESILESLYGSAWKYVDEFMRLLQKEQLKGYHLINYAQLREFKNSYLSQRNIQKYITILAEAKKKCQDPSKIDELLLQVYYAQIELGFFNRFTISEFKRICLEIKDVTVNEQQLSWKKYIQKYD